MPNSGRSSIFNILPMALFKLLLFKLLFLPLVSDQVYAQTTGADNGKVGAFVPSRPYNTEVTNSPNCKYLDGIGKWTAGVVLSNAMILSNAVIVYDLCQLNSLPFCLKYYPFAVYLSTYISGCQLNEQGFDSDAEVIQRNFFQGPQLRLTQVGYQLNGAYCGGNDVRTRIRLVFVMLHPFLRCNALTISIS